MESRFYALILGLVVLSGELCADIRVFSWETKKGAKVNFVRAAEIPMVDIRVVFGAGSVRDGRKYGLAKVVNRLLLEGAGELEASGFKDKLAMTGANLYADSFREMAFISLRTLKSEEYYNESLDLLTLAVTRPQFNVLEMKRVVEEMQLEIALKEQSLGAVADESLWGSIYKDHPYGNFPLGNKESLESLQREDLLAFFSTYYVTQNAVISIVGDLEKADAIELSEKLSEKMLQGKPPRPIPDVTIPAGLTTIIDKQSKQTHIRLGQVGISRNEPDYFPLLVGNHALGGNSLVSVLFQEIREKRGLSYSTYSYFVPMEKRGPFVVGMQTENEKKDEALKVLREQVTKFLRDGPSDTDLKLAKANLIKGFPNRIDSNQKILGYLSMIGFYGLPSDYLTTFPKKIENVNKSDVVAAFREKMPLDFATVVVGEMTGSD
jgi:zinc protease